MSKVVRVHQHGGPEQLRLEELEVRDPGPGRRRLRMEAIGLNRAEAIFRAGAYLQPPALPTLSAMKVSASSRLSAPMFGE